MSGMDHRKAAMLGVGSDPEGPLNPPSADNQEQSLQSRPNQDPQHFSTSQPEVNLHLKTGLQAKRTKKPPKNLENYVCRPAIRTSIKQTRRSRKMTEESGEEVGKSPQLLFSLGGGTPTSLHPEGDGGGSRLIFTQRGFLSSFQPVGGGSMRLVFMYVLSWCEHTEMMSLPVGGSNPTPVHIEMMRVQLFPSTNRDDESPQWEGLLLPRYI